MKSLNWTQETACAEGICEREFEVYRGAHTVPGVLWYPAETTGPRPLVLMGHGGSGHKRNDRMLMLARLFTTQYGWYAAAIDGPVHGNRGPVSDANHPAYREMWQRGNAVEQMIDDWKATLDALVELDGIDPGGVGYWGVSMGTMFGLPYVASDARVRAAVLGKAGMSGPSVIRSGIDTYFRTYAPKVHVPVLFTIQWDDERFERDGQLALFDRIGAKDKRLHAYPGLHIDNGPEAFDFQAEFLNRYL
jgi:dienelactone hydrolase